MRRISTDTAEEDKHGAGLDGFTDGDAELSIPPTRLNADWFDSVQEEIARAIESAGVTLDDGDMGQLAGVLATMGSSVFGDGSDGDVTITGGTTTLTRDMFYESLTIESTGVLATAGYTVYVRDTLTTEAGGLIHRDGNVGGTGGAGGAGGAALAARTLGGSAVGGAGSDSTVGEDGAATTNSYGGRGGSGGDGLSDGGLTNTPTAPPSATGSIRSWTGSVGWVRATQIQGGGGGGGGGRGSGSAMGGGGGGGGGVVGLVARHIVHEGVVRAAGGAGGSGLSAAPNSGSGGGGGGGVIFTASRSREGAGTYAPTGGAAGGASGSAGLDGQVFHLRI